MDMKLVLPPAYVAQASELVRKATKRVFLISMVVADHPATHELIAAIEEAAMRGVKVTVTADIFTYGEVSGGFLPIRYYSPGVKDVNTMVKRLRASGVKFLWLGRARMTLFNGRTHSKWLVVDDTCFVFGGVNMYQGGVAENTDYMFRIDHDRLADRLAHEQGRIIKAERTSTNYPSVSHELHGDSVLIDGGIIAHSVIYRRALELAEEAESILFVSQYCPTGKLSRLLKKKEAALYFNRPEQADFLNKLLLKIGTISRRHKTLYTRMPYLHAKFIIFTMKDGSKTAISGSHNFAYTGVLFGTREIALETTNPQVIGQLESFYKKYIA